MVLKDHLGTHLEDKTCTFNMGDPVVKGPGIRFMKRKKASSNYETKQCKKHTIQRLAFKGTVKLFAVKEYWHEKLQRIKVQCKNLLEFSFKPGKKRPGFTVITTAG
jgi:hypothetical protein